MCGCLDVFHHSLARGLYKLQEQIWACSRVLSFCDSSLLPASSSLFCVLVAYSVDYTPHRKCRHLSFPRILCALGTPNARHKKVCKTLFDDNFASKMSTFASFSSTWAAPLRRTSPQSPTVEYREGCRCWFGWKGGVFGQKLRFLWTTVNNRNAHGRTKRQWCAMKKSPMAGSSELTIPEPRK